MLSAIFITLTLITIFAIKTCIAVAILITDAKYNRIPVGRVRAGERKNMPILIPCFISIAIFLLVLYALFCALASMIGIIVIVASVIVAIFYSIVTKTTIDLRSCIPNILKCGIMLVFSLVVLVPVVIGIKKLNDYNEYLIEQKTQTENVASASEPMYQVETGVHGETYSARLGMKNLIPIDERDKEDFHLTDRLYYDSETGIVYFGSKYFPSAYYSPNGKPYKYDPDRKLFTESD